MKGKKLVRKLLMFLMVFTVMIVAEAATQQKAVYAEAYDYVWCENRGAADDRAGYNMLLVTKGKRSDEDLYAQCINNWYSVETIESMINYGFMLDYEQQLKDGGWIPYDYIRTPMELIITPPTGNSSQSSSSNVQASSSNSSFTQEEIDAAWMENKRVEATCIADGYIEYKNSLTEETKTEALPMLEHDYEETARVEATCEAEGSITYTCVLCNEESYEETIKAEGHQSGEWVVVKEPALFSEGLQEQRCVVDNVVLETATIAQTSPLPLGAVIAIGVAIIAVVTGVVIYKKRK